MKNEETQQGNHNVVNVTTRSKSRPIPKYKICQRRLALEINTWEKQSHGLFDYQSPLDKLFKEIIIITEPSRVFRNTIARRTTIRELKEETKNIPERVQIFNVNYDPSRKTFVLKNTLPTQLQPVMLAQGQQSQIFVQKNKLFLSLTSPGPGHKLGVGDFVKMGRVELVVLQIHNAKKTQSIDFQQIYGSKQYIFHLKEELQGSCKVCLSDEATQSDPLVNPCNCKGSCGVIHLNCLKNWINNKVKRQIYGKVRTYNFEKFSCEICKAPFPSMIRLENGDQTELLNFQRPTSPYILLQQCSQTQQKHAKTLHFILPELGNRVNIGRGQICQLNISDISVSRNHSYISFQKNGFSIYDLNSKFGTLVEVKQEILLNSNIRLQHNGCSIKIEPMQQKRERSSKSGKKTALKKQ